MTLRHHALLQIQRDLFDIPLGRDRFDAYINLLRDASGEMRYPLSALNPMGHDHNRDCLDHYIGLGLDEGAGGLVNQVETTGLEGFSTCFVLADDARGQWTNRWAADFSHRFESKPMLRRNWIVALLWTSEPLHLESALDALRVAIHRAEYITGHGYAVTLGEILAQEGYAQRKAGLMECGLSEDEQAYTREILEPILDSEAQDVKMAVLYGDEAANTLGYAPIGLSHRAGLEIARFY